MSGSTSDDVRSVELYASVPEVGNVTILILNVCPAASLTSVSENSLAANVCEILLGVLSPAEDT